jgi:hypothetical protein
LFTILTVPAFAQTTTQALVSKMADAIELVSTYQQSNVLLCNRTATRASLYEDGIADCLAVRQKTDVQLIQLLPPIR